MTCRPNDWMKIIKIKIKLKLGCTDRQTGGETGRWTERWTKRCSISNCHETDKAHGLVAIGILATTDEWTG